MWIRTIEKGVSYGALSASNDIAILNDYATQHKEDIDYHFAAVNLKSLGTNLATVTEMDTGLIMFIPEGTTTGGVWGSVLMPVKLPSLKGIMESQSKQIICSQQMDAVIRAFDHVAVKYSCIPIRLGKTLYTAFIAKGRKWDLTVLCSATKTTQNVLDVIEAGWAAGEQVVVDKLDWSQIPRPVKKIMGLHLGVVKDRFRKHHEQELLEYSPSKVFKSLSLEEIFLIGKKLGLKGKKVNAHDVLKELHKNKP